MTHPRTAIVTGASRGMGRAIALRLAAEGHALVVNGTNATLLDSLVQEIQKIGGQAEALAGDVSDPDLAKQAQTLAAQHFGGVGVLVNNAGINTRSSTLEMPLEDWNRVMDVNLNSVLHFCRAVLPGMIDQGGGRIINISSTTAKTPHKNAAPAYGASKAAVNYLTLHLAQEMAPHGILVNAVCPGPVETDMSQQWSESYRAQVTARVPLGRLGRAEDIAGIVAFLASKDSDFITGTTLNANGGTFMA